MNASQFINQTSGSVEYFTPPAIIEAARTVLGGTIDLDPASCPAANKTVGALRIYTKEDDGLSKLWCGRVFMNHPFSDSEAACRPGCKKKRCDPRYADVERKPPGWRGHCIDHDVPGNAAWIKKLIHEWAVFRVSAACCICFASTSESWFQPLFDFPLCFLCPRTNYLSPNGSVAKGVTKGSVVAGIGVEPVQFAECFASLGRVMLPPGHAAAFWRMP